MKRFLPASLAILASLVLSGAPSAGDDGVKGGGTVDVKLSGLLGSGTSAKGDASFTLSKDGSSIHYELKLERIGNATMAHVHETGPGGSPGAVVAWLFPAGEERAGLREGTFSGTLASGDITAERLRGPLKGRAVKELFGKLGRGEAGVAVHTKAHPGGELWGFAAGKAGKAAKETKAEEGYSAPGY